MSPLAFTLPKFIFSILIYAMSNFKNSAAFELPFPMWWVFITQKKFNEILHFNSMLFFELMTQRKVPIWYWKTIWVYWSHGSAIHNHYLCVFGCFMPRDIRNWCIHICNSSNRRHNENFKIAGQMCQTWADTTKGLQTTLGIHLHSCDRKTVQYLQQLSYWIVFNYWRSIF